MTDAETFQQRKEEWEAEERAEFEKEQEEYRRKQVPPIKAQPQAEADALTAMLAEDLVQENEAEKLRREFELEQVN